MKCYPGSLHNHSEFSNLDIRDSTNRLDKMIDRAIELGHSCIAFTEHENVCNAIKIEKYYKKIKEKNPDFKVIRGNEIYLVRNGLDKNNYNAAQDSYYHFILLAKDAEGHKQIRELSTRAWGRSWRIGKMTRRPTYYQDLVDIIGANPGHIIGSTACLGGFFAKKVLQMFKTNDMSMEPKIKGWLNQMISIFGKDDFYLEMQPSDNEEQIIVNNYIINIAKELNLKYIITCDAHYLTKEDRAVHSAFLKSQEADRETDEFYSTTYLMSDEEIKNYFKYLNEDSLNKSFEYIEEIKNKCEEYSLLKPLKIPSLIWRDPSPIAQEKIDYYVAQIPMMKKFLDSDFEGDGRMIKLIINKLESDERLRNKEHYDMINSNLNTTWISSEVNKTHWSAYFLNLQKNIDICWEAGTLVGPGRGSGVGFLLLYLLDITQINPLWEKTATFEWRFLNPERVSVLDIDTDIEGGRRGVVLEALRNFYGRDRVANVLTFGTEGTKSCIQTAARGLGIDNDEALYISSLVPSDRGMTRTLKQTYYGDEENGFEPVALFRKEMDARPDLWRVAQSIEGLICRVGEHAGGVIFVDEDFVNSTALMKVPNGDTVTQFDLHDCEDASLIKIDLLSVECLDKIHNELDLLVEHGKIEKKPTLKETYESVIGIYNLERDNPDMWQMVWDHKIQSLFQMEQQSGIAGIATLKPTSVDDLAVLNSTIRLMAQEGATERPTDKLARFKRDPEAWNKELKAWRLGAEEKAILEPVLKSSYGLCIAQEQFMQLVQLPELGGFNLTWADKLRKSIAKKNPKEFDKLTNEFYKVTAEKGISQNFAKYVWEVLISMSKGYGFNQSHTLAYSLVALQEMNLAYRFPLIYWNTACLITDTGGNEDNSTEEIVSIYEPEKEEINNNGTIYVDLPDRSGKIKTTASTNYDKLADGINKMQQEGIKVYPPDINKASFTFQPDEESNHIMFGLRGILGVGNEVIDEIMSKRPFKDLNDLMTRTKFNKQVMVSLIKSGALDSFGDRITIMHDYLWEVCDRKKNLNLQNLPSLMSYQLLPVDDIYRDSARVYNFNRYLKAVCKNGKLDDRAVKFLIELNCDNLIQSDMSWNAAGWKVVYDRYMNAYRTYIINNKQELLDKLNNILFNLEWDKYATGNLSSWEMETICYYYHEHELENVNKLKYGIENFFNLPEEPVVEKTMNIKGKEVNFFKLTKICGTCLSKNKSHGTVKVLTTDGVVEVRFGKEYFSMFDRTIKLPGADGKNKIADESWFSRGSLIMVTGVRNDDTFVAKTYKSTGGHKLYKIEEVMDNGEIRVRTERVGEEIPSI